MSSRREPSTATAVSSEVEFAPFRPLGEFLLDQARFEVRFLKFNFLYKESYLAAAIQRPAEVEQPHSDEPALLPNQLLRHFAVPRAQHQLLPCPRRRHWLQCRRSARYCPRILADEESEAYAGN